MIYFIVGCGRSGKTTTARALADHLAGAVVVDEAQFFSRDVLLSMFNDRDQKEADTIYSGLKFWADGRETPYVEAANSFLCNSLGIIFCQIHPLFLDSRPIIENPKSISEILKSVPEEAEIVILFPRDSEHLCPCGCGKSPEIDLKTDGDPAKTVDTNRGLYIQVCREEWNRVMKGRRGATKSPSDLTAETMAKSDRGEDVTER